MADDSLPAYMADGSNSINDWINNMAARAAELDLPLTRAPWTKRECLEKMASKLTTATMLQAQDDVDTVKRATQQEIAQAFFDAVQRDDTASVMQFVRRGLVSPDLTDGAGDCGPDTDPDADGLWRHKKDRPTIAWDVDVHADGSDPLAFLRGTTPLLQAVNAGHSAMVRVLIGLGADVNALAVPPGGNKLPHWIAYLLIEYYLNPLATESSRALHPLSVTLRIELVRRRHGRRTALMLAAAQGRVPLVKLLRGQYRPASLDDADAWVADDAVIAPDGQTALRLAASAKHGDVVDLLPVRRGGTARRFKTQHAMAMARAQATLEQLGSAARVVAWDLPRLLFVRAPVALVHWARNVDWMKVMRETVKALWETARSTAQWLLHDMPRDVWRGVTWLVRSTAMATRQLAAWVAETTLRVGRAAGRTVTRTLSALHTVALAVATRLRNATLADVGRGFVTALHAVFVGLPRALARVVAHLGATLAAILMGTFGCLGEASLLLLRALRWLLLFVPRQLGHIMSEFGGWVAAAVREGIVFVNPKYAG